MKFKTTKKEIMNGFCKVIEIGYVDLWDLLQFENPVAYTCGGYGWSADIYDMGRGVAIVTGYRPFGNISPDYQTVEKFNKKARQLRQDLDWEKARDEIEKLLNEFVGEVTK